MDAHASCSTRPASKSRHNLITRLGKPGQQKLRSMLSQCRPAVHPRAQRGLGHWGRFPRAPPPRGAGRSGRANHERGRAASPRATQAQLGSERVSAQPSELFERPQSKDVHGWAGKQVSTSAWHICCLGTGSRRRGSAGAAFVLSFGQCWAMSETLACLM